MANQDDFNKVVEIISKHVRREVALKDISMNTNIIEDLDVNSARVVDIILAFEDAFDIEIDDEDAGSIQTIGDAVALVEKLKK